MTNLTPPPAGGSETPDDRGENRVPDAPTGRTEPAPVTEATAPPSGAASATPSTAGERSAPAAATGSAPASQAHPAFASAAATGTAHPRPAANGGGAAPPAGPTPPPATGASIPPQSEAARIGTRAVAITATAVGAVVLLFGGASAAFGAVHDSVRAADAANGVDTGVLSAEVEGITAVDVDHGFGDMRIVFGDVTEAELEWAGEREWRFERDGGTLEVRRVNDGFGFADFDWFGDWDDDNRATLTLPESLEGVDLDVDTGAGAVNAEGEFGDVSFDLGAGSFEIEGSATTVDGEVSAGDAIVELTDVREFDAQVSAGKLMASLEGEAPDRVGVEVSAGGADITLPDVEYDVRESASAGSINTNNLQVSYDAPRIIEADVSAGDIDLRAG